MLEYLWSPQLTVRAVCARSYPARQCRPVRTSTRGSPCLCMYPKHTNDRIRANFALVAQQVVLLLMSVSGVQATKRYGQNVRLVVLGGLCGCGCICVSAYMFMLAKNHGRTQLFGSASSISSSVACLLLSPTARCTQPRWNVCGRRRTFTLSGKFRASCRSWGRGRVARCAADPALQLVAITAWRHLLQDHSSLRAAHMLAQMSHSGGERQLTQDPHSSGGSPCFPAFSFMVEILLPVMLAQGEKPYLKPASMCAACGGDVDNKCQTLQFGGTRGSAMRRSSTACCSTSAR